MSTNIPLGKPYLDTENILGEIRKVLDAKWISGGPTIAKFEEAVKDYNKGGFPVAVANGTIAIDMALLKLNNGKRYTEEDEIIIPSWSWVASGFSPINVGATPVWCDVNGYGVPDTHTIRKVVTEKTRAIIIVHQMGIPCDLDAINALGEELNIPIIEDAACAFGAEYKGVKIGNSKNLVTYSLQARKCLTTGEGGFVIARTQEEAEWFKSYRAFGTSVSPLERDKAKFLLKEQFGMLGTNHKISDITAAVGLAQLSTFEQELHLRNNAGKYYNTLVKEHLSGYAKPANIIPEYCTRYNWQNFHILLDSKFNRDEVVDKLRKRGIGCKWDIQCIHLEPVFEGKYSSLDLWSSKRYHDHGLWLPFYAEITVEDQVYVIETLKEILNELKGIDTIA